MTNQRPVLTVTANQSRPSLAGDCAPAEGRQEHPGGGARELAQGHREAPGQHVR